VVTQNRTCFAWWRWAVNYTRRPPPFHPFFWSPSMSKPKTNKFCTTPISLATAMAFNNYSQRGGKGRACQDCFESKRRCEFSEENQTTCTTCLKSSRVCLPRVPNKIPSKQLKRKNESSDHDPLRFVNTIEFRHHQS
jgi:hypothetical protein